MITTENQQRLKNYKQRFQKLTNGYDESTKIHFAASECYVLMQEYAVKGSDKWILACIQFLEAFVFLASNKTQILHRNCNSLSPGNSGEFWFTFEGQIVNISGRIVQGLHSRGIDDANGKTHILPDDAVCLKKF